MARANTHAPPLKIYSEAESLGSGGSDVLLLSPGASYLTPVLSFIICKMTTMVVPALGLPRGLPGTWCEVPTAHLPT